ncbi:protein RocB [Deinococcus carri]|uniref:Protein RocB n=1 Tax=Deinococcus carri TaxID=1211323 RepID=A0ABP9W6A2_9DEIO
MTSAPDLTTPSAAASWAPRTRAWLDLLVGWPSVTGSLDEQAFAPRLHTALAEHPYFQAHPEHLWRQPALGGGPENLLALVRGEGPETVILSGHYDTVSVDPYGSLAPLAHQPEALRAALLEELQPLSPDAGERLAWDDLAGGDFLPGRGVLDMKGGIAAGLSVLEHWLEAPGRRGNLLVVLSPDEEDRSRGARAARHALGETAQRWGLTFAAGINLDATSDLGDGAQGRSIALGTVGKLLPFVFMLGRGTHAGYPFEGLSAHAMSAELLRRLDTNPEFADHAHGESAPPPACLELRDLRGGYDVTTPDRVWSAYNVLTHRRTPAEVLDLFCSEVGDAMHTVIREQARRAAALGLKTTDSPPRVLTFGALRQLVLEAGGPDVQAAYEALVQQHAQATNPLDASREVTDWLTRQAGLRGPVAVVGFAGLHYPHTHVTGHGPAGERLRQVALYVAASTQPPLSVRQFFAGISDMSFLGAPPDQGRQRDVQANTAVPAFVDAGEDAGLPFPVFPTVNVGPWGREYHQRLERVHLPYALETLPEVVWRLVTGLLPQP